MVPLGTHAQTTTVRRVAWLDFNPSWWGEYRGAVATKLNHRGWIVGQNLVFNWRQPADAHEVDRLPEFAVQLVRGGPDILVAWGNLATKAATAATQTIPIVAVDDPVGGGLVASLTRPGGNVTGVASKTSELAREHLKLLAEVLPGLSRVDMLHDAGEPGAAASFTRFYGVGQSLGVRVVSRDVRESNDLAPTFEVMRRDGAQAVFVGSGAWMVHAPETLAQLARDHRLPMLSAWYYLPCVGGFLSYHWDEAEVLARTAEMVDRILKGAKPGELPIEYPVKLRLAINMTTAKALGLTIPPAVLGRAEIIY
jgi:putative ABC transport system substrate-binding protein